MESILGNTRKPDIVFSAAGRIDITSSVVQALHLSSGDVLDIMVDQDEFYLYVKHRASDKHGRHTATAFPSNKRGKHYRASSKKLCAAILRECNVPKEARLCVGRPVYNAEYGTLLPIVTKCLL